MTKHIRFIPSIVNLVICWFLGLVFTSCSAQQAHWDSNSLRQATLDYYDTEIVDNLIRAYNGQPMVAVDITQLNAQITPKLTLAGTAGQTITNNSYPGEATGVTKQTSGPLGNVVVNTLATTVGSVSTMLRSVARPLSGTLTAEEDKQIQMNAVPQIQKALYYQPYLQFLNLPSPAIRLQTIKDFDFQIAQPVYSLQTKKSGERLVEDDGTDDAPGVRHYLHGTLRHYGHDAYYVPVAYKQAYFDLSLALIAGIEAAPSPTKSNPKPTAKVKVLAPESPELEKLRQIEQSIMVLPH